MTIVVRLRLHDSHEDYGVLSRLETAIYGAAGGKSQFESVVPELLRQAIDEVIDASRSRRFTLDELEKTELTYLGTKIEILLRNALGLERGRVLDLLIDGVEVDVKNTVRSAWTIPLEALGHPCILIKSDEKKALCSFGLIVIRLEVLNRGRNRDQKATIKVAELGNVHWLLKDAPYPMNFWQTLGQETRHAIVAPKGGTDRIAMLFRLHQRRPISRKLIVALAQQDDPMKRLRRNGGARDPLALEGIYVLSGKTQSRLIAELGLPFCRPEEFISYSVSK